MTEKKQPYSKLYAIRRDKSGPTTWIGAIWKNASGATSFTFDRDFTPEKYAELLKNQKEYYFNVSKPKTESFDDADSIPFG